MNLKKSILLYITVFIAISLPLYIIGLKDDAFIEVYLNNGNNIIEIIINSFKYYFLWILPYWGFPIAITAIIICFILITCRRK